MVRPLFAFVFSALFFGAVGVVVLRRIGIRPVRLPMLAVFVIAAQLGGLAFAAAYAALFANAANRLTSAAAVVGFLVGVPIAGTVVGALAARAFASRST